MKSKEKKITKINKMKKFFKFINLNPMAGHKDGVVFVKPEYEDILFDINEKEEAYFAELEKDLKKE